MQTYKLPTGFLFTDTYSRGQLETLSIGDYGKAKNVKADFLGYTKEINGVPNGETMPLSEKWVITLSTQYGCPMKCTFCDVPNLKFNGNASFDDLKDQLYSAIRLFPNVKYTDRLNVHFARMGDGSFNEAVLEFAVWMYKNKNQIKKDTGLTIETLHPVFTTMFPKTEKARHLVERWAYVVKNTIYNGQAGLQFSINSTNEDQRNEMFQGMQTPLIELSEFCKILPEPVGRKYCLNFALADGYETDGKKLRELFDPEMFMVKITPIHNNNACEINGIKTKEGYHSFTPYNEAEESFNAAGFDVLVFIPSQDEEDGIITCGNAILGGSELMIN
jgi:23S rRNA (adenine2503-C2)-methyltransferase